MYLLAEIKAAPYDLHGLRTHLSTQDIIREQLQDSGCHTFCISS